MIEQIAASLELDQLRQIFEDSLKEYKERAVNEQWNPSDAPIDVHNRLREVAAEVFSQELYGDQMEYQASILRRCTKLYNKGVGLIVDLPYHVD